MKHILTVMLVALTSLSSAISDQIAIIINDHVITEQELNTSVTQYAKLSGNESYANDKGFKKHVSQMMATHVMLAEFAEKNSMGLTVDEEAQAVTQFVTAQDKTVAQFGEVANEIGVNPDWLRGLLINNQLQQKVGAYVIAPSINIDEAEINEASELWIADNTEYKIKSWTIAKEDRESFEALKNQITSDTGNTDVSNINAIKYLKAQWAKTGSEQIVGEITDLGWVKSHQLPKLFLNTLSGVEPGNLLGPVESDYGYHLIWFEGENRPQAPNNEAVLQALFQEQFVTKYNEWLTELMSYNVVIYK